MLFSLNFFVPLIFSCIFFFNVYIYILFLFSVIFFYLFLFFCLLSSLISFFVPLSFIYFQAVGDFPPRIGLLLTFFCNCIVPTPPCSLLSLTIEPIFYFPTLLLVLALFILLVFWTVVRRKQLFSLDIEVYLSCRSVKKLMIMPVAKSQV
jgi:hypothetical protein